MRLSRCFLTRWLPSLNSVSLTIRQNEQDDIKNIWHLIKISTSTVLVWIMQKHVKVWSIYIYIYKCQKQKIRNILELNNKNIYLTLKKFNNFKKLSILHKYVSQYWYLILIRLSNLKISLTNIFKQLEIKGAIGKRSSTFHSYRKVIKPRLIPLQWRQKW